MLLARRVLLTSELTGRQSRDRISASAAASGSENIVFSYSDLKEEGVRADHTCIAWQIENKTFESDNPKPFKGVKE